MKSFCTKLFLLTLPIVVVGVLMEIGLRNIPNDYKIKGEYLEKHSTNITCLILGSSHTFYGINTNLLPHSFNAAYLMQSLDYDLKILKRFEGNSEQLKTVVLPISYLSLFEQLQYTSQDWRAYNYNMYYHLPGPWSLSDRSELLGKDFLENVKHVMKYHFKHQDRCIGDSLGFGINAGSTGNLITTGIAAARNHERPLDDPQNLKVWKENNAILEAIVRWTKEHEVELVLLTTPCYQSFVKSVDQTQKDLFISRAQEVADQHSHVRYLNYFDSPLFSEQHFRDATHLSAKGAKLLTELLQDTL